MVAYSFKARFADQVAEGRKSQTIRAHRKRHARVGEPVQLYFAQRTKHCRKLISPDPVCISIDNITIWVPAKFEPTWIRGAGSERRTYVTDEFARADGFAGVEEFTRFWFDTHGSGEFQGVLIRWKI